MAGTYRLVVSCILILVSIYFIEYYFTSKFMYTNDIRFGIKKVSAEAMNVTENEDQRIKQTMGNGRERRLPTVLIIGFMKCGTGALRKFLSFHPNTVTSYDEETIFFGNSYKKGIGWYRAQMQPSREDQVTFEKSNYFTNPFNPARNIYETNNNMKLILILRNPVQRTISHFAMAKARAPSSVTDCPILLKCVIKNETGEVSEENKFIGYSMYFKHLSKWLVYFPLKQFLILDGDLFSKNPLPTMKKVEQFLGLPEYFDDSVLYYDKIKGFYCHRTAQNKTECLPSGKGREHPFVSRYLMKKLYEFFKLHNEMLFALIKKRMDWS